MRVHWATDYCGDGNSFGYSVHNDEARRALVGAGATLDPRAPVAVHVAPAHRFRPVPNKLNVLYTAWESTDLTPSFCEGLARADAIAVTARFLVDPVRRAAPGTPVGYCPLGVRHEDFPLVTRSPPSGRPFRFLWLGAPNARKGWEIVREAWRGFARLKAMGARVPAVELHVKTSVTGRLEEVPVRGARVVFDSRRLARPDLARLYQSAHCFLFPSFGEGFGLTMAEALATGLPAIFTPWSATADLADESSGYPLRYRLVTHDLAGDGSAPVTFAQADAADLVRRMLEVMSDYPRALRKGRLAARRIRKNFTWDRTGKALSSIIRSACARRGVPT
ncbi:MAG: glycosyltransferase family 4 protein [Planctomycetota bacterium]